MGIQKYNRQNVLSMAKLFGTSNEMVTKCQTVILCLQCHILKQVMNLINSPQMPRIWLDYCQFLIDQYKITRTRRTFDRALRALPLTQHKRIWPLYLKFIRSHDLPETAVRVYRRFLKVRMGSHMMIRICMACFVGT